MADNFEPTDPSGASSSAFPRRSTRLQGRDTPLSTNRGRPDPRALMEAAAMLNKDSKVPRGSHRHRPVAFVRKAPKEQDQAGRQERDLQESLRRSALREEAATTLPTPPLTSEAQGDSPSRSARTTLSEAKRARLQAAFNRPFTLTSAAGPNSTPVQAARTDRTRFQPGAGVKRAHFEEPDHLDHHHHRDDHHHHYQDANRGNGNKSVKRLRDNQGRPQGVFQQLPQDPIVYMLSQFGDYPEPLELEDISSMFAVIQERIFGNNLDLGGATVTNKSFTEKYFDFILTDAQCATWPLHELKTKYVPLFLTAQYLADGSQYGWRNFFTQPQFRRHLVGAILGEWFTQRIFKHTAFGIPEDILHELEELDREYLGYDAIVRTKKRGQLLHAKWQDHQSRTDMQESVKRAAEHLAQELMVVLHPLLPPPIFDPLDPTANLCKTNPIRQQVEATSSKIRTEIQQDLLNLVLNCSTLHMCIRLSGKGNGTIVRVVPYPSKGSQFHPTAPVDCVNQQWCNQTIPLNPSEPSQLCIKLTSWPRVEAVVPHGPDMADLGALEMKYRARDQRDPGARRPSSLNNTDAPATTSEFSWDKYEEVWPVVPDDLQDREGRHALAGKTTGENGMTNTVKRAAYVTVYPSICHAKVYCEWTPQPAVRGQTLSAAVHAARRALAGSVYAKHRVEDLRINLWNTWAWYGGLAQWGLIAAGLMVALFRGRSIPASVNAALWRALGNIKSVQNRAEVEQVREYISDILKELIAPFEPLGRAVAAPLNVLTATPLQRAANVLAEGSNLAEATLSSAPGREAQIIRDVQEAMVEEFQQILESAPAAMAAAVTVASAVSLTTPEQNNAIDAEFFDTVFEDAGSGDVFDYETTMASDKVEPDADNQEQPHPGDNNNRAVPDAGHRWIRRFWGNR